MQIFSGPVHRDDKASDFGVQVGRSLFLFPLPLMLSLTENNSVFRTSQRLAKRKARKAMLNQVRFSIPIFNRPPNCGRTPLRGTFTSAAGSRLLDFPATPYRSSPIPGRGFQRGGPPPAPLCPEGVWGTTASPMFLFRGSGGHSLFKREYSPDFVCRIAALPTANCCIFSALSVLSV